VLKEINTWETMKEALAPKEDGRIWLYGAGVRLYNFYSL